MKKKLFANIVMVLIIVAIFMAGVFTVGHIKGWFDTQTDSNALLSEYRGNITVERDGIAFIAKEDIVLRKGDKVSCDPGATVIIKIANAYVALGQNAVIEIQEPKISAFEMHLYNGEAFINTDIELCVNFADKQKKFFNTVSMLSVRSGAQTLSVLYGEVDDIKFGQSCEWVDDKLSIKEYAIQTLNDFHIAKIREANNNDKELFFSNADLDKLEVERWEAVASLSSKEDKKESDSQAGSNKETSSNKNKPDKTEKQDSSEKTEKDENLENNEKVSENEKVDDSKKPDKNKKPNKNEQSDKNEKPGNSEIDNVDNTESIGKEEKPTDSQKPTNEDTTESVAEKLSCTITIRCDTILDNWDNLDSEKAAYVPSDGCILPVTTIEFTEGDTVFDVLKKVCDTYDIAIEYSWTPMYDSYYIEGINNLYEFDCGSESGWMYKVNEWFPNYGCSSYVLTGNETIVWCYTCVGLGEDVGAEGW